MILNQEPKIALSLVKVGVACYTTVTEVKIKGLIDKSFAKVNALEVWRLGTKFGKKWTLCKLSEHVHIYL